MSASTDENRTIPVSKKIYIFGDINKINVGMSQISLSDSIYTDSFGEKITKSNSPVTLYDTAGVYSDPEYSSDVSKGIPRLREQWYGRRKDLVSESRTTTTLQSKVFPQIPPVFHAKKEKVITQMHYAKKRIITPEMEYVAIRENQQVEALGLKSYITPDFVRKEIAAGRAIIPANVNHPEAEPMIIGQRFLVKINANILSSGQSIETDIRQMVNCCRWGADTLIDLSNDTNCSERREWLLRNCPIPLGTSPLYEALNKVEGKPENLNWPIFREVLIAQLEQGVDIVAIHAAMRKKHLRLTENRLNNLVSYSGIILYQWMKTHKEENFLFTHFNEICEIIRTYDAVLSIGSGLRPGSIYDANDRAQFAELAEMRGLTETAWGQFVETMTEGPGHVPMNKIETNIKEHHYVCKGVPFFTLGLTTTDIAGHYDYIASAIGSAQIAWYGASLISGSAIQRRESIPTDKDLKANIIAHKIAAHAADLAKGHPGAQVRDNALSKAIKEKRLVDALHLSIEH